MNELLIWECKKLFEKYKHLHYVEAEPYLTAGWKRIAKKYGLSVEAVFNQFTEYVVKSGKYKEDY